MVASTSSLLRPPRLRPGDRVALVAPSSLPPLGRPRFRRRLREGIAFFEALGLRAFVAPSAGRDPGYLGRDPQRRADDLVKLARDPDVRAMVCVAGGASGLEILPFLEYPAFRRDPKAILGFSDATAFLNAITRLSGVVTFHGENVLSGYARARPRSVAAFRRTLLSGEGGAVPAFGRRETWRRGVAEGTVWGGNLYTARGLLGTPYAPDYDGAVLFWEELEETNDDLNAMLWHLRLAGVFDRIAAMVVGDLPGIAGARQLTLRVAAARRFPILKTRDFGHGRASAIIPIGVRARVDAGRKLWELDAGVD